MLATPQEEIVMVGKIAIAAAAIVIAALLLVNIAGWANPNKLEAQGPRIDPFKLHRRMEPALEPPFQFGMADHTRGEGQPAVRLGRRLKRRLRRGRR